MPSTPGHHLGELVLIGDCVMVHKGSNGGISGILLKVAIDDEPLHIGIVARQASQWPEGVTKGDRLHVRGRLRVETLWHRKATHFLEATHPIDVIRRCRKAS
jgi:hypothetical protein